MTGFLIGDRKVGDGAPCLIVAEVAQAHEGSIGMAHAYIDAVANAGADAIKWQCHIADAESWPGEPWRVKPDFEHDKSRYDYWKRMEFTQAQWSELEYHATEAGLIFLCSPFSVEAVKLLDPLVPAWKVASGEVTNWSLLWSVAQTGKPIIVSTGMSTMPEIRNTLRTLRLQSNEVPSLALMQCTTVYPCPPEQVGLGNIRRLRKRFNCPVGLSDHSGSIYSGLGAVALGADLLEVHVCFSKAEFGFDVESSVTTDDLARLVEGARVLEKARKPVRKDWMAEKLEPMRELFMRKHERRAME